MESLTQTKIVAIIGASGSGKSTVVERLKADPEISPSVIQVDHYYRDLSHLTYEQRDSVNFDHPDAIEFETLRKDLQTLKRGQSIDAPIYDFTVHNRVSRTQRIEANSIIILEGLLALADAETAALVDQVVFIDTPLEVCLKRRIERDGANRGRSEASVRDFWVTRAAPMFNEFIAPWKAQADLVLSGEAEESETQARLAAWLLE
ncbi:MAG: uridine kinase [Halieaceae bacterium]|jgi:uridine kinase